ncbi:MAG TPA: hypothetical protein VFN42_00465 [Acetobacteraceae bacterium]|nr:hypothetical protein [Acetobacteraceae bacterium]
MFNPKRPGSHDGGLISGTLESALTASAVVLMLASVIILVALISTAFVAPRVGDVVRFRPGSTVAEDLTFPAHRAGTAAQPGASCVLDPATMVQGGGSLVVESRFTKLHEYQVHWAGQRTASGAQDCGRSVDLTLRQSDLETLVNAMGGRGLVGRGDVF